VEFIPLSIAGAFHVRNVVHRDDRGEFSEWFRIDKMESATGYRFPVAQANLSRSAKGVVRGIHFADVPPGQAKLVTCLSGSIRDIVVDIRVGSPTFGTWVPVDLDSTSRDAVLLPVGVGHAFVAKEDNTLVAYLVSDVYTPHAEHGIHPLDPDVGIDYGFDADSLLLSPKDQDAPTLRQAKDNNLLPLFGSGDRS
jgi:dTDP-4-dehydrorhamnose 3,5-epimerase